MVTSSTKQTEHATANNQIPKKIKSEIILGSPSAGCEGVGICRVMLYGDVLVCKCRKITAWIVATDCGAMRIIFPKAGLEPGYIKRHFGSGYFHIAEPYPVPLRISRAAGLARSVVAAGHYRISESEHFLNVDF